MKKVYLTIAGLLAFGFSKAQDYKNSIGIRFGESYYESAGVSFKSFISKPSALEFDLGIRTRSVADDKWTNLSLSGAYQYHIPLSQVEGMKFYYGAGAILTNTFSDHDYYKGFSAGLFPTIGVDYKLKKSPFAFSIDFRPTVHIVKASDYYKNIYFNGGVTARYTF